jgi:hypothetical protein
MLTISLIAIFVATMMSLAPSLAMAELDVQVYEGEGAVGIVVSEGPGSGFDVVLDGNSTVIVSGSNSSLGGGAGNGSEGDNETIEEFPVIVGDNETGPTLDNQSSTQPDNGTIQCITEPCIISEEAGSTDDNGSVVDEEIPVIEIPHINNVTVPVGNGTEGNSIFENITSSTDVIEIVSGGNVTTSDEGSDNSTSGGVEVIDEGVNNSTTETSVEDQVTEIVNEGLGCLSGDELRKLIQYLSVYEIW